MNHSGPAASKSRLRYLLRHRTDQEWLAAIGRVRSGEVRVLVACIVWWDFWSEADPRRQDPHALDAYKSEWDYYLLTHRRIKTKPAALAAALVDLGYHPDLAAKRAEVVAES